MSGFRSQNALWRYLTAVDSVAAYDPTSTILAVPGLPPQFCIRRSPALTHLVLGAASMDRTAAAASSGVKKSGT